MAEQASSTQAVGLPVGTMSVVLGNVLVYRDAGHLTATFAAAIGGRLESAILADVAGRAAATP